METLFQWSALLPEIVVAATALLLLVLGAALPAAHKRELPSVALAGLATAALAAAQDALPAADAAFPVLWARLFFLAAAFFTVWSGAQFVRRKNLSDAAFPVLVLVVTAAFMRLVQSENFVEFFVAFEVATIGLSLLVVFNRASGVALEAGMKHLLPGAFSGVLLLLGVALLYGAASNPALNGGALATSGSPLDFAVLRGFIAAHLAHPLVLGGAALVTAATAFKVGMFPFQFWVPDVYQGAPMPVAAFLATAAKTAGVLALFLLMAGPFEALCVRGGGGVSGVGPLFALVSIMAGATLVLANLTALGQANVKRLMGLSSLSHAGFMLIAVLAAVRVPGVFSFCALFFYAAAHLAGAAATFGVMGEVAAAAGGGGDEDDGAFLRTSDYQLLRERHPLLATVLCAGLGSLAGAPPTLGFFAKFGVLAAAFQAGLWTLSGVALLSICAGVYYYFAWIREAFQRLWVPAERRRDFAAAPVVVPLGVRVVLAVLAAVLLFGGLVPGVLP
ncbi:MAG: hypothetical protein LBT53_02870 [Puniceicoccales bacterium]|jgi:NADH-quinone oxidoreductase subunit N|nr:hypothetical protein [Puniceicoccales bacterium]